MQHTQTIQNYINNFRRHLSPYLNPGIGLACKVFPAESEGAILEFSIGADISNEDQYMTTDKSVNEALKKIEQRMFGGNLDAIRLAGTNISMESNRILLIKGEDKISEWNDKAAGNDVKRILSSKPQRQR